MVNIRQIIEKERYMELFLEADPEREIVEKYLKDADVYGIFENDKLLCEVTIVKINDEICELKNIATIKDERGKGYARKIIAYIAPLYRNKYKRMIVGTTENNIPFYVKCGFDKYYKTVKNFFIDNYTKEIWDGDLQCIDMYYYFMDLTKCI